MSPQTIPPLMTLTKLISSDGDLRWALTCGEAREEIVVTAQEFAMFRSPGEVSEHIRQVTEAAIAKLTERIKPGIAPITCSTCNRDLKPGTGVCPDCEERRNLERVLSTLRHLMSENPDDSEDLQIAINAVIAGAL